MPCLNCKFSASTLGKTAVNDFHSLFIGAGTFAKKLREYLRICDFILLLGARLPPFYSEGIDLDNIKMAQVDSDPYEIGRSFTIEYSSVGSIQSFVQCVPKNKHGNSENLKDIVEKLNSRITRTSTLDKPGGQDSFNTKDIVEELSPGNAIIVCDTGYSKEETIQRYRANLHQIFITSDRNGCMGYSVPAALGTSICTDNEVICF